MSAVNKTDFSVTNIITFLKKPKSEVYYLFLTSYTTNIGMFLSSNVEKTKQVYYDVDKGVRYGSSTPFLKSNSFFHTSRFHGHKFGSFVIALSVLE